VIQNIDFICGLCVPEVLFVGVGVGVSSVVGNAKRDGKHCYVSRYMKIREVLSVFDRKHEESCG